MRVFLSWSGDKSRAVASALKEWLPSVINSIEPFVSSIDIDAGMRWQNEIAKQLESTSFGIVCVTWENQSAPWLNFEAGALAKAVDSTCVVPLAIDLTPSDVKIPLGQFQAKPATASGISEIVTSLNDASPSPLPESRLARALAMWWPELATELDRISKETSTSSTIGSSKRTDRELLEELVDTVRGLSQQLSPDSIVKPRRQGPLDLPLIGARVAHAKFGAGEVVEHQPGGIILVRFGVDGTVRKLMWEYSPLVLLDEDPAAPKGPAPF